METKYTNCPNQKKTISPVLANRLFSHLSIKLTFFSHSITPCTPYYSARLVSVEFCFDYLPHLSSNYTLQLTDPTNYLLHAPGEQFLGISAAITACKEGGSLTLCHLNICFLYASGECIGLEGYICFMGVFHSKTQQTGLSQGSVQAETVSLQRQR